MESLGVVIAFYVLSTITIGSALAVFLLRNLVHAIVLLVLSFLGMAGLFLTLSADFIAISQILIYAGAISVLLVFAVMLTPLGSRDNANSLYINIGAPVGFLISLLIGFMAEFVSHLGNAFIQDEKTNIVKTGMKNIHSQKYLDYDLRKIITRFDCRE